MVVALEKKLSYLKYELEKQGFDVVMYGEYPYPIDALVYTGALDITSVTNASYHADTSLSRGIFLVNAHDKDAEEIAEILKRKTYTTLF